MSLLSKLGRNVGNALRRAAPVALGLATGGTGTALIAAASALGPRGRRAGPGQLPVFTGSRPGLDLGDIPDFIRRVAPGGASGRGRVSPDANGRCPQGYHPAKDGRGCVRNRSMNPMNHRAARRAIRRIRSGEKQYKKIFSIMHKQSAGKVMPRRKGR